MFVSSGVRTLFATLRDMWNDDGLSVFVCTPLVLIKFLLAFIRFGINLFLWQPDNFLRYDIASHHIELSWSLRSVESFTCTPAVLLKFAWLTIQELFGWFRAILLHVKFFFWKVSFCWSLTLESVESFACTPLVVTKLIWLLMLALLRLSNSVFFMMFLFVDNMFCKSVSLFQFMTNIICSSFLLIRLLVTCVGGWTEWLLIFTMILLEEYAWTCAFKSCFVWVCWTLFRCTLWKQCWPKLVRTPISTPYYAENHRQLLLAEAKHTVKLAKDASKELSATIEQHVNGTCWSGRSARCIFVFLIAFWLSWVSSWHSTLPWNRHISTATEVFACAFICPFVSDFNVFMWYLILCAQIYNIVSNFKCSEYQHFIENKIQQKQYIESIQHYAVSNLRQMKQVHVGLRFKIESFFVFHVFCLFSHPFFHYSL